MVAAGGQIESIRWLYVELLYECNYRCRHCFQGPLLDRSERLRREDVQEVISVFADTYHTQGVTFLGGEPLLYTELGLLCSYAADLQLRVEVCSNGHFSFRNRVKEIAPFLNRLRLSLDGLEELNDLIRRPGGFRSAMKTIALARGLGVPVGVTMTVAGCNVRDVGPLAHLLAQEGVDQLKLHAVRPLGNARNNLLFDGPGTDLLEKLRVEVTNPPAGMEILCDPNLFRAVLSPGSTCDERAIPQRIDRIELDPQGGLTVSCNAVGMNVNALRWDRDQKRVVATHRPVNEFSLGIGPVRYANLQEQILHELSGGERSSLVEVADVVG